MLAVYSDISTKSDMDHLRLRDLIGAERILMFLGSIQRTARTRKTDKQIRTCWHIVSHSERHKHTHTHTHTERETENSKIYSQEQR